MRTRVSMVIAVAVVMSFAAVADAQPGRGGFGGFGAFGGGASKLGLLQLEGVQKELDKIGFPLTDEQKVSISKLQEELRANSPFGRGRRDTQGRTRGNNEGGDRPERGRPRRPSREDEPDTDDESRLEFQPGEYFVQDDEDQDEERQRRIEEFRKQMEERREKEKKELAKILLPEQLTRLNEIYYQALGLRALQDPDVVKACKITEKQQEEMREVQQEAGEKMRDELRELFQSGDRDKIREKFTEMQKEIEKDVLGVLKTSQKKEFEKLKGKPVENLEELMRGQRGRGQGGRGQGGRGQGGRGQGGRGQGGRGQGNNDT